MEWSPTAKDLSDAWHRSCIPRSHLPSIALGPETKVDMVAAAFLVMVSLIALSVWIASSRAIWGLVVMAASCLALVWLLVRMARLGRHPRGPDG